MSKILILDIYSKSPYRISKDTNGGYGTTNDLGYGIVSRILSRIAKSSIFWPPLNALNLASELINSGHNVAYSNNRDDIDYSVDFIFMPISIVCFNDELSEIKFIRKTYPKIKIFCFGSVINFTKDILLDLGTSVFIGEPEFIVETTKLTSLNLKLLFEQRIIHSPFGNPDNLSIPLWSTLKLPSMRHFLHGNLSKSAPIIATRGCPYPCAEYCTYPIQQGKAPRARSKEMVLKDVLHIKSETGAKNLIFRDPVFTINKKYSAELLDFLGSNLDNSVNFAIETHLNNLDDKMISLAKKANVTQIKFGIESVSSEVLEDVQRYTVKINEQIERVNSLRKNKIRTTAFYILCQPLDTLSSIDLTVDYAIKLKTSLAQFSIFTPYPGTPYYEKNKENIISKNYNEFTQFDLVYKHKNFTPYQAKKILGKAYRKYYLKKLVGN